MVSAITGSGVRLGRITHLWLRRRKAAQFVIVYAYIPAEEPGRPNIVSIRAVRHGSVADVFEGVREPQVRSSMGTNFTFSGPI
jgi:hypothetical protein